MYTKEAHGTMTINTSMCVHWVAAVVGIAGASMDDVMRVVGLDRLHRWWSDGMTAGMAADSLATWLKIARVGERADREDRQLRARIADAVRAARVAP